MMMAEARRYPLGNQLDIQQILVEAQHRWLRPAEICEILRNYQKFRIAPEPAHLPPSGSLFLFDRKILRYFRKDGHNWRKKKDGKTVKEAHERLKSGSIDVLHCYYAHGEENENFQRRSYWMLEEELSHIVLVHYRDVKQGSRTNFNCIKESEEAVPYSQSTEDTVPNSEMDISVSSNFHPNGCHAPTQTTDTASMNSAQASDYEDAESVYNHQDSSMFHSFLEVQKPAVEKIDTGASISRRTSAVPGADVIPVAQEDKAKYSNGIGLSHEPQKHLEFSALPPWEDVLDSRALGYQSMPFHQPFSSQADTTGVIPKQDEILGQLFTNSFGRKQEVGSHLLAQDEWQTFEVSNWAEDQKLNSTSDVSTRFFDQEVCTDGLINTNGPLNSEQIDHSLQNDHQMKKLDSFTRWMTNELGDVGVPNVQSSAGDYWDTVESEHVIDDSDIPAQAHLENYMLGPSLSQDQLFNIIDFSPNWAYVGSETKVLVTGRFLTTQEARKNYKWSCMFGEIEVPAEVIADGVLRCLTPLLKAGRVPFYITCSNRVACSEVREFEYRVSHVQDMNMTYHLDDIMENLQTRFGKLLCLNSRTTADLDPNNLREIPQLSSKINSLLKEDTNEWEKMLNFTSKDGFSLETGKEQLLEKLLKEKLYHWLLQKAAEGEKGPSVLDEGGQGVLHFAAALGCDWALEPTILAGVSVNFRDVNGWTALHWAASCGRERTVASLIHLGAAVGAPTDPTPKYPGGRTPADLASANGHKGIAGYLAESALNAQLSSLNLNKQDGDAKKAVHAPSEHSTTPVSEGDLPDGLSLQDSLAAVCNATQTAARIHQVFRVQSFQKKQLKEYGNDKFGMSHERALSLLAVKSQKAGQLDEPVHAAIKIQNKFRGWKGRKEFLIIRERIVKIQAHVRGHQVRKNYRKIVWSVGIVEKVILRWRRKGRGLRGFKSEALTEGSNMQSESSKDDDYDFFKEGRRQTEVRSQIALARVKSMHQYPEARDQYRRLRNVVAEIQESKANNAEAAAELDSLIELEKLLEEDSFMHAS